MSTQTIIDNQISGQIENRIDIEIQYTQHKNMEDYVRLYENKGLYSLGLRAVEKFISKAEYQEILRMIEQDHFGKNFIKITEHYDTFWNKYFNFRDNEKLEKIGIALFGKSWKKALAEALKVDERRITHWLQCSRPIPKNVFKDLKVIKDKRLKEIQSIEKLLD
ncbi:hypothetical protein APC61_06230 [Acinetobacter baumannii]|uniref:XRE family transcriptional regulator n=1 Tax=Acinetobacter baumannii TaxID=470 RepID=A0AB73FFV5_ACIBA|nr:hypothetical protein [Acinetobacter baumannii]KQD14628.1 hypothetical protein APD06_04500 [Acinetobacter baumannii]KRI65863.1 hypothetical protein APC61_06230 [Acinetobacter baumannii]RSQ39530.1 hypothetical protein EA706_16985 [Acinetobacter baumannii]